jgi:signal transduction histidine kinase
VVGLRDRLAEQRITYVTQFPERVGTFRADESRVRQILFNLVSNAVRFSHAGGRIELKGERRNGWVVYTVRDNGIGIPEDVMPTVFDRFEGHAPAGRRRGAGLGLAIVKSLVELHGGSIEITSAEGKGTAVVVSLPEAPEAPAIAAE